MPVLGAFALDLRPLASGWRAICVAVALALGLPTQDYCHGLYRPLHLGNDARSPPSLWQSGQRTA